MSTYIITDKENIIGSFSDKNRAFLFLIDYLINNLNFYIKFLNMNNNPKLKGSHIKIPLINSLKITNIIDNSTIINSIFVFNLKELEFVNILSNQKEVLDTYIFTNKINELKNCTSLIENKSNYKLFTSNDILFSEMTSKNKTETFADDICDKIDIEKIKKEKEKNLLKDKLDEYKRRYEADIKVYLNLKDQINDDNVPELFIDQYPIMTILDKLNLFDKDQGFNFYYKKMQDIIINKPNIYSTIFNDSSNFYVNNPNNDSEESNEI